MNNERPKDPLDPFKAALASEAAPGGVPSLMSQVRERFGETYPASANPKSQSGLRRAG